MHPPPLLKDIQSWFGSVLRTPLQPGSRIHPQHEKSAKGFIPATPQLHPHERIEIYNQQYWWRLFSGLQNILPATARLLGKREFNQTIALPYLLSHNPSSWSLYSLVDELPGWIEHTRESGLVKSLALLDCLFYSTFFSSVIESINIDPEKPLFLQPHVRLLSLSEDLIQLRKTLLDSPLAADPIKIGSPEKKVLHVLLFRKACSGMTFWQELLPQEYAILKAFEKGATLAEALDHVKEEWDISASFQFFSEARILSENEA